MYSIPKGDIREHFDTNDHQNIFISKILNERMSEYICIKKLKQRNICIANLYEYSNIFEYSYSFYTHERMSKYIRANKFDTNE